MVGILHLILFLSEPYFSTIKILKNNEANPVKVISDCSSFLL